MQLISERAGNIQIVTVEAQRIDAAIAIKFKDDMRVITDPDASHVILNLEQVDFIDSSGLGAIVASMKQLGKGQKMDLAGLTSAVSKVFRLTRMDTVFAIHDTAQEARVSHAA